MITRFEDLEVWKLGREIHKEIYEITLNFGNQYDIINQMRSSLGSILDNIAEGFHRDGNKEFIQFLSISKGSAGELSSQLYRSLDRKLIDEMYFNELNAKVLLNINKIGSLMNYLKNSEKKGLKYDKNEERNNK